MKLKSITKSDFNKLDISRRIIVNEASHEYAAIDLGEKLGFYGLSWGSDIIKPIIQISEDKQSVWVGVDQKLAMIRLSDGQVNLIIALHTFILKLLSVHNLVAVLTELEVMLFNTNGLLKTSLGLPDLAENITFENGNFLISLFDGSTLMLNPNKSTFNESVEDYLASQSKLLFSRE